MTRTVFYDLTQRLPNILPCGPLFANLLFYEPQLYVTLLLSPDLLTIITINIRIQKEVDLPFNRKKKGQHLYYCRYCVTRGSIHRQARVTFYNVTEVIFRDFLLFGTNVDSLTDRNEATDPCAVVTDRVIGAGVSLFKILI